LIQRLAELGYAEGRNLVIERRYSEGKADRFPDFAAEMVRLKVDLIIVITTPAALAVKSATKTIPVVFPTAIDPVGAGLATGLARPGGNITGLTTEAPDLVGKRLQLLKEAIPGLARVAVLWNAANPANARSWEAAQDAGRVLGMAIQSREVRGPTEKLRAYVYDHGARASRGAPLPGGCFDPSARAPDRGTRDRDRYRPCSTGPS
jgi:putative ABC transport system substrate-binding protein